MGKKTMATTAIDGEKIVWKTKRRSGSGFYFKLIGRIRFFHVLKHNTPICTTIYHGYSNEMFEQCWQIEFPLKIMKKWRAVTILLLAISKKYALLIIIIFFAHQKIALKILLSRVLKCCEPFFKWKIQMVLVASRHIDKNDTKQFQRFSSL